MSAEPTAVGKQVTILGAINSALADALETDDKVLLLGEDVGDGEGGGVVGLTKGLSSRFGNERVRSTPFRSRRSLEPPLERASRGGSPLPKSC